MKIGVLGAGQLGQMIAQSAIPLGVSVRCLTIEENPPASAYAEIIKAERYEDEEAITRFASGLDAATTEFENVPSVVARAIESRTRFHPSPDAIRSSQDRVTEKDLFNSLGIPTPQYSAVKTPEEAKALLSSWGGKAILKTRRLGYDGKGQVVITSPDQLGGAFESQAPQPLILESFVQFSRELSIIAVRDRDGNVLNYPLVENLHHQGILRRSKPVETPLTALAVDYAKRLLEHFNYVGVIALEMFEVDGALLANEFAPRVHNSGHWTIEGAVTSQFENHVRTILGLPLGKTEMTVPTVMFNLIGSIPSPKQLLAVPGLKLHLYGKESRPGRKLGHCTLINPTPETVSRVEELISRA